MRDAKQQKIKRVRRITGLLRAAVEVRGAKQSFGISVGHPGKVCITPFFLSLAAAGSSRRDQ
jgi:hypothetical protein